MLMDRRVLILALVATVQIQSALADSPKITAVLTSSDVVVGETVQLQIQIDNAGTSVKPPSNIDIPGLQIHYTGESTSMTMRNLSVTSSITYNYTILPEKSGTYKIPSQSISVSKNNLQTPELTLRVADSPNPTARAGSNRAPSGNTQTGEDKIAFAELLVPKKTAYVGEMIPVVVRIGFNSRTRVAEMAPPQVNGQGFTVQKLGEGERNLGISTGAVMSFSIIRRRFPQLGLAIFKLGRSNKKRIFSFRVGARGRGANRLTLSAKIPSPTLSLRCPLEG